LKSAIFDDFVSDVTSCGANMSKLQFLQKRSNLPANEKSYTPCDFKCQIRFWVQMA